MTCWANECKRIDRPRSVALFNSLPWSFFPPRSRLQAESPPLMAEVFQETMLVYTSDCGSKLKATNRPITITGLCTGMSPLPLRSKRCETKETHFSTSIQVFCSVQEQLFLLPRVPVKGKVVPARPMESEQAD